MDNSFELRPTPIPLTLADQIERVQRSRTFLAAALDFLPAEIEMVKRVAEKRGNLEVNDLSIITTALFCVQEVVEPGIRALVSGWSKEQILEYYTRTMRERTEVPPND